MINVSLALKGRLQKFIQAYFRTTVSASAGDKVLTGDPELVKYFDVISINQTKPKVGILPLNSSMTIFNRITAVDKTAGTITLQSPLEVNVPSNSVVKRSPGWQDIQDIFIGEVEVIPLRPAIEIIPVSENASWMTLEKGEGATYQFKINLYVEDDKSETSTINCMSAAQDIKDLLMADLRLKIPSEPGNLRKVYNSMPSRIDFGYISKGTIGLKAAQISWEAQAYILRRVIDLELGYDHFDYYPGDPY